MKREIKFRAYHNNENKMYKVFRFCNAYVKVILGIGTSSDIIPIDLFKPIMQYTGLKDKNGIEIYEGDIVELYFKEYYSNDCVTVEEESKIKGYVSFDSGGWFLNEKDSTWFYLYDIEEHSDLEIIGNIHENPELLC